MPYLLEGMGGTFRNPLLDFLLPSLLYIKMVVLLDDALELVIKHQGLKVPKHYGISLKGRIEFLKDQSVIADSTALHNIRRFRNLLAHETSETATWDRLRNDLDLTENELRHLGMVGERPKYEYFGERSAMRDCPEPGIACAQDFCFGVKHDDRVTMSWSFTRKIHNSSDG